MNIIERAVHTRDAANGVRALVSLDTGIQVESCPREYLTRYIRSPNHTYVPALYILLGPAGEHPRLAREGETKDILRRMSEHASDYRWEQVLIFSGPRIDKSRAECLQYLARLNLELAGCDLETEAMACRPIVDDLTWACAERDLVCIRALTRELGLSILESKAADRTRLYQPRTIAIPEEAEAVFDYLGSYTSTAALLGEDVVLLRHSQIRLDTVSRPRPIHAKLRRQLAREGNLARGPAGSAIILRDMPFPSLDATAKFLRGDSAAGRHMWRERDLSRRASI